MFRHLAASRRALSILGLRWAADARGYWVMHQGARGRQQGQGGPQQCAEPIQQGDDSSVVGRERDSQVDTVEKELRGIHRTFSKQVNVAARRLADAETHKARRLYRGKGIRIYEDRIETRQGVARFATNPIQATVHFGSSAEEPQVIVDALDFVSVLPSKPGKAGRLANTINQAASLAHEIAAKRVQAISAARLNLEELETERDKQTRAAESRLEAARICLESPPSESSG